MAVQRLGIGSAGERLPVDVAGWRSAFVALRAVVRKRELGLARAEQAVLANQVSALAAQLLGLGLAEARRLAKLYPFVATGGLCRLPQLAGARR
jgi:hypothetical protein